MQTETDVANNALSFISAGRINSLYDEDDPKAGTIRAIFDSASREVMRGHRWSCCIARKTLSKNAGERDVTERFGYQHSYKLPVDSLRFLDLNGEPWTLKGRFFDVNGRDLLTNASEARIRYVKHEKDTTIWDSLLAEAIAIKIAMKVARQLTTDGISAEALLGLYKSAVMEAQRVDAMEVGSGENSPLERILESSPLVQQGRRGSFGIASIIGLDLDISEPR